MHESTLLIDVTATISALEFERIYNSRTVLALMELIAMQYATSGTVFMQQPLVRVMVVFAGLLGRAAWRYMLIARASGEL